MKMFLGKFAVAMTVIMAVSLIFGGSTSRAQTAPRPILTRDSVNAIMQTQAKLETAMTLGIIAATPGYQPKDPYSISELEKASARAQKEIDFLNRIKSASTTETLKAKAKALLQAPTQSTSDDFRNVLTMYIKQVKGDLIAPLWKEMVPMTYTDKSLTLVRQLEQQATKM